MGWGGEAASLLERGPRWVGGLCPGASPLSVGWAVELGWVCGARGRCPVPSSTAAPPSLLWVWKGCRAVVHHCRTPRRPSPCPSAMGGGSPLLLGSSRAGPLGSGVGGWWERRPPPVAVHSPAGERPQGPVPAKRPPRPGCQHSSGLRSVSREVMGNPCQMPRDGVGVGQASRQGWGAAARASLGWGRPLPGPTAGPAGWTAEGGAGSSGQGLAPPPAPRTRVPASPRPPPPPGRPPSAFLGERAQLRP